MADKKPAKKTQPGQEDAAPEISPEQALWDKVYYNEFSSIRVKYSDLQNPEKRAELAAEAANAFLAKRDEMCNVEQFEEEPDPTAAPADDKKK